MTDDEAKQNMAQEAAELLHQETGAPFVVVILTDGCARYVGAWVPTAGDARELLRDVLEQLDAGTARVHDRRRS